MTACSGDVSLAWHYSIMGHATVEEEIVHHYFTYRTYVIFFFIRVHFQAQVLV